MHARETSGESLAHVTSRAMRVPEGEGAREKAHDAGGAGGVARARERATTLAVNANARRARSESDRAPSRAVAQGQGTTTTTTTTTTTNATTTNWGGTPSASRGSDEAPSLKIRKPYTITKKRERWTEDEHVMFLQSLKAHGRAWRKIEEQIGTKTAVQIRSHAQKFFSKLQRETSKKGDTSGSENAGARAGDVENESKRTMSRMTSSGGKSVIDLDIEIPPARPKRKPAHPYPRKATSQPSASGGGGSDGSGGTRGGNSGGTGKSTQTALKSINVQESKDQAAHAASSAAVAAVLSVASDSMQCNLQADMRAGYFGVPQAYPGMMNIPMVNPYVGMANPAAGVQNPPQMSNPQQFLNYISMLSNMWVQKAAAPAPSESGQSRQQGASGGQSSHVDRVAAAVLMGMEDDQDAALGKKSAFSSIAPKPGALGTPPLAMPFSKEQFSSMQAHFASIMQAAALGYMAQPNGNPMNGMSGFMSGANGKIPVPASGHNKAVTSQREGKNVDNGSDGSDKSDDGEDGARRTANVS